MHRAYNLTDITVWSSQRIGCRFIHPDRLVGQTPLYARVLSDEEPLDHPIIAVIPDKPSCGVTTH